MRHISPLLLAIAALVAGCTNAPEAQRVAVLTEDQLMLLKAQAVRQQQLLKEQRAAAEARINRQLLLQTALRNFVQQHVTDWGDDPADRQNLALLARLRSDDEALRTDPFGVLFGEPPSAPTFDPPRVDLGGLDTALVGVAGMSGDQRLTLDDLVEIAAAVNAELARLQREQEE